MGRKMGGERARSMMSAALLATAAVGPLMMAPSAHAQAADERSFDIPAQPLADALVTFGIQSGMQVTTNGAPLRGVQTDGVRGNLPPVQALGQLLSGTGFTFRISGNVVTLEPAPQSADGAIQLGPVRVEGEGNSGSGYTAPPQAVLGNLPPAYAGGQVARGGQLGMLGNTDLIDAPFNITSYTAEVIENQQARSVGDVLANDPSVRIATSASAAGEYLMIRGFPAIEDSIFFNGLAGLGPNNRSSTEMVERVEVLKGPSAAISGMVPNGSVGGTVMLVPKRATDEPLTRIGLDYATRSQVGARVDLGRRFGENKTWGIRVNGVLRDGEGTVQSRDQRTGLISVALDYRGERLRMALDAYYQRDKRDGSDYFIIFAGQPSAVPNASKPMTRGDTVKARDSMVMARVEYDLTPQVTAYAAFGERRYRSDWVRVFIQDVDQSGSYSASPYHETFNGNLSSAEMGLRAQVNTGTISHRIALAGTYFERTNYYAVLYGSDLASNIFDPVTITDPGDPGEPSKIMRTRLKSVALTDTLGLWDERLLLTLGLRHQQVSTWGGWSGWNNTATYKESATSPIVALVYKPTQFVSLYANYVQGLTKGPVAPTSTGLDNAGEVFPPYKSKQYELGIKGEWNGLGSSLSLFQISRPNSLTVDNRFTLDGEQRNRGVEWNVYGTPVRGVRVLGGVMLMNAKVTKAAGATQGNWAAGIPKTQLNLGAEWDVTGVSGLTLSGRALHTGSVHIDSANLYSIPAWTRWDVGARYVARIGDKSVTLRANVENLFDKSYWMGSYYPDYTSRGGPRTLLLSATFDF